MSATLSLFAPREVAFQRTPPPTIELRPYQVEACARIDATLAKTRAALLVMATGTGKTSVFAETIRRRAGRCMVVAHRGELIDQAAARIRRQVGKSVSIEKAGAYAGQASEVVIASVQSLKGERLERFRPDEFELIVIDEAHHSPAASYQSVVDWFSGAKILGVTATPDRADEVAMSEVFDEVAYVYEIEDAIGDGWLCPIRATQVACSQLDLSAVGTVAGDLNQGQLDAVMAFDPVLRQVAEPTIDLAGARRTLVFTTTVATAHLLAAAMNRYRPECARAVDGLSRNRAQTIADHQAGRFQFLVNVQVLTEGYDDPQIACISMARPTKSRGLYAQMAGRGTRIADGKTDLLILDFVGNSGRHALVSATDILAGRHPDEVARRAREKVAKEPAKDVRAALAEAEEEIAAETAQRKRREEIKARSTRWSTRDVDPFAVMGIADPGGEQYGYFGGSPPSEKQVERLRLWKLDPPKDCTGRQAQRLINHEYARRKNGWCTYAQSKVLQRYGYDAKGIRVQAAGRLMDALAANRWQRLSAQEYAAAAGRPEPGSDG